MANLINSVLKNDEEKPLYNPKEIMFSCSFSEKKKLPNCENLPKK
jgi:hypothetical protein